MSGPSTSRIELDSMDGLKHRKEMTKPKTKPCPVCQAPNPFRACTCSACASSLRPKLRSIEASLKSGWAQNVLKNHNSNRVLNSAMKAVSKLHSLGLQPILFTAKPTKAGKFKWDLIHFIQPEKNSVEIIQEMHKLYKSLVQDHSPPPVVDTWKKHHDTTAMPAPSQTASATPVPSAGSSYYIIPAPRPAGTTETPYYVLPAVHPAGPTPVPAPTSYQFIPAPQPSGTTSLPGPTPYYLIPTPQLPGTTTLEPYSPMEDTQAPSPSDYATSMVQREPAAQTQTAEFDPVKAEENALSIQDFFSLQQGRPML